MLYEVITLSPKKREFSESVFENKIIKNIAALANLGKEKKGYLFIGVTDVITSYSIHYTKLYDNNA